jgi:cleavage and polyadenylation specificity factor subunit 3
VTTAHHHHHPHVEHEAGAIPKHSPDELPPPSRIDRLLAFLDSHFGNVDLLTAEEARASVDKLAEQMGNTDTKSTEDAAGPITTEGDDSGGSEREQSSGLPGDALSTAPVIRVRVDQYVADVSLETLVSFCFVTITTEIDA